MQFRADSLHTLLRWAPAQGHGSSASAAFRVGIELGDIRCPETHPFCPPDDFRKVHFCPEKSRLNDVGIASSRLAKPPKIADAHRGDGKRFVVSADEKLTAFVELESAILHPRKRQSRLH